MSEILKLQPEALWRNFHLLTQVPRPSGHLEKIQQFLLDWAKERNLEARLDNAGNILMYKPASPGMEDRKVVTLQGHIDMVPQKTPDSPHNFETDPIETWIDGDWVRARNTTLGADDGMAIATIMAIFEDDTLCHGPLEAFMTSDEETTMYGVEHMEDGLLKGEILLNLDNETHGELMVGSAGGINLTAELEFKPVAPEADDKAVRISLHGLRGGHSGLQINEGRANANKNLARVVADAIANFEARLAEWKGGNMRNAIPREAEAVLTLPAENVAALKETVETEWQRDLFEEYGIVEPNLKIEVTEVPLPATLVPEEIQDNLVDSLLACHNGVLRFIPHLPTIVETSSNLAIVEIVDGRAFFKVLVRSSRDSMRQNCVDTLEACFSMAGMKVETDGAYPAWQPSPQSEIVELMAEVYQDLFGEPAKVQVVHAGLECSVILSHCPNMDVVSFGPTLESPHTPNERCFIPSVDKYWRLVLETLARTPKK
ncbi:MAG: aminoacyl-histidine dipeptidase [Prevotellaceae bacterium]|nr:aminoacyl-histidine dipeptidase [Prevotellaceae bacterium]